jgi:hypothetical protein
LLIVLKKKASEQSKRGFLEMEGGWKMDFNRSNRKELQNFIKSMLNECRKIDGFWFLEAENEFGYNPAIEMSVEVWSQMGKLITREIKERFSIKRKVSKVLSKC